MIDRTATAHKYLSLNGKLTAVADAVMPLVSSAALYGKGIFTTVAVYDGVPFQWDKHWRRLEGDAATVDIDLGVLSEETIRRALDEIIAANNVANGRARVTLFEMSASPLWPSESAQGTGLMITTGDPRPVTDEFRLTISPYPVNSRSPLAGVKSCNYLENIMALDDARRRGFSEAIRLNERGEIASACMANVFWSKDGVLYTPGLATGCLAGTTREYILENVDCRESRNTVEALNDADAIFLTSAGIGVIAAAELDGRALGAIPPHILESLPIKNTKTHE